jgi:uncharacterized protein (DUF1330 family)
MNGSSDSSRRSFRDRIDPGAVRALLERELPAPIDALNLVFFADERSYRWYGVLLAPTLLPFGARPVWVGVHERSLSGAALADEIVIVRYPNHRLLLRAVTGRYYAWVNRWRERGVRAFAFSLTERVFGDMALGRGPRLFVHYNERGDGAGAALEAIRATLEQGPTRLCYASRETSPLAIFHTYEPSDPNPAVHKRTAAFEVADVEALARFTAGGVAERLGEVAADLSLQVYRPLSVGEAMPWAARTAFRDRG